MPRVSEEYLTFQVLASVSETNSVILYLRDADRLLLQSERLYKLFHRMIQRLSGSVLIIGSRRLDEEEDCVQVDERLSSFFPYNIVIKPPEDETHLMSWKAQLEEDMKMLQVQDNRNHIAEVLAANDIVCDDLGSFCHVDTVAISNYIEEIVISAISYHLMNNKDPEYRNGKLVISSKRLETFLFIFESHIVSYCMKEVSPSKQSIKIVCFLLLIMEQLVPWTEHFPGRERWGQRESKDGSKY